MKDKKKTLQLDILEITLLALMTAVIEVSKMALSAIPNVELVSFWIIMFTLFFGPKVLYSVLVFVLIEISIYGVHVWVIMYLYVWPVLILITWLFRKQKSGLVFAVLSSVYGFLFGALCSIPYIFIGSVGGNIRSGLIMAFNWWMAGVPFDITHGIANFVLMLVLYRPVYAVMKKLNLRLPRSGMKEAEKK